MGESPRKMDPLPRQLPGTDHGVLFAWMTRDLARHRYGDSGSYRYFWSVLERIEILPAIIPPQKIVQAHVEHPDH